MNYYIHAPDTNVKKMNCDECVPVYSAMAEYTAQLDVLQTHTIAEAEALLVRLARARAGPFSGVWRRVPGGRRLGRFERGVLGGRCRFRRRVLGARRYQF